MLLDTELVSLGNYSGFAYRYACLSTSDCLFLSLSYDVKYRFRFPRYLRRVLLDTELVSLGNFSGFDPAEPDRDAECLMLDGTTLTNLQRSEERRVWKEC